MKEPELNLAYIFRDKTIFISEKTMFDFFQNHLTNLEAVNEASNHSIPKIMEAIEYVKSLQESFKGHMDAIKISKIMQGEEI
jgi:hypothetical protein